jgi:hypothetical protein
MHRPDTWSRLTWPVGNNAFAYEQRKRTDADPKLRLPELKTISTINDLNLWTLPTFAELDDKGNVLTYTWLEHIYHIPLCTDAFSCVPTVPQMDVKNYVPTPTYIFDNHNYALYFWWIHEPHGLPVIHIDQHADLAKNTYVLPKNYTHTELASFTTGKCNVGNFIIPALDAGIISECIWIKNQYNFEHPAPLVDALLHWKDTTHPPYIIDIDLDFRVPEMGISLDETLPQVQKLMRGASLITIATSPYFLDQQLALDILWTLFS